MGARLSLPGRPIGYPEATPDILPISLVKRIWASCQYDNCHVFKKSTIFSWEKAPTQEECGICDDVGGVKDEKSIEQLRGGSELGMNSFFRTSPKEWMILTFPQAFNYFGPRVVVSTAWI